DVGPQADIYSLGLVLIEALTGRRCFPGSVHESVAARLTTSPSIPTTLPQPWPRLLAAMTARDPAQRPAAAVLAETLRTGAAPTTPKPRRVEAPVPVPSLRWSTATATSGDAVAAEVLLASPATRISRHSWWLITAMVVAGLAVGTAFAMNGK